MVPEWIVNRSRTFTWLALILLPVSMYLVFMYAPMDTTGQVQRIFYVHVATAWNAYLFIGVVALCSLFYLIKNDERWNQAAKTAGELGVLFTTLTLIAGSLWARPIWNTWWTWDPRLTTTLILWFIYVGYVVLLSGDDVSRKQKRFAAIYGIVGFVDIPIIHFSVRLWRSIHPSVIQPGNPGMPQEMLIAMIVTVVAFTIFGVGIWGQRLLTEKAAERIALLREEVLR